MAWLALRRPIHGLEIDDPASEKVESTLSVEPAQGLIERNLNTADASLLHVLDRPLDQPGPDGLCLETGMHHQIDKESIGYSVAEDREVPNELALFSAGGVVGVVALQG